MWYIVIRIGGSIFTFWRAFIVLRLISIKVSRYTHEKVIKKLLKAPINLFYDVTPTG